MIDTLLTEVSGRAGEKKSYVQRQATGPLAGVRLIDPHGVLRQQDRQPGDLTGLKITGRLDSQGAAGRQVYAAKLGHATSPMPRHGGQQATTQIADLSSTGQQISRLFGEIPKSGPVNGQQALLANPAPGENNAVAMATALKQSVNRSGLFFEAQILAWIRGRMTKTEVMRNPQAETQKPGFESSTTESTSPHEGALRQQLELLAGNGFSWRGEAWPGSNLEWHLRRETERDENGELVLQSDIRLTTAGLGPVEARIRHLTQKLEITAWAEHADSRASMKTFAAGLQDTLLSQGFSQVNVWILTGTDDASPTGSVRV